MKALILKDLNLVKTTWKIILIFSLAYPILFSSGSDITAMTMFRYVLFMVYILCYNYIFYHEYKSMNFVNSLPASRFMVICSRYISLILISILSIMIVIGTQELLSIIGITSFSMQNIHISFILENFLLLLICSTFMTPFIIRFGVDLGKTIQRVVMMGVIMGITMAIYSMEAKHYEMINIYANNIIGGNYKVIIFSATFILYIISMVISIYIYDKKEF